MHGGAPLSCEPVLDGLRRHARAAPERIAFTFVREDGREESLSTG